MCTILPSTVNYLILSEYLCSVLPWGLLVRSCCFLLNGKEAGIEPTRVENGFLILVLPSLSFPMSDQLYLPIQGLPTLHQKDQNKNPGIAMVEFIGLRLASPGWQDCMVQSSTT